MQEFFEYEVSFYDPNGGPTKIVMRFSAVNPVMALSDAVERLASAYPPVMQMNVKVERV